MALDLKGILVKQLIATVCTAIEKEHSNQELLDKMDNTDRNDMSGSTVTWGIRKALRNLCQIDTSSTDKLICTKLIHIDGIGTLYLEMRNKVIRIMNRNPKKAAVVVAECK